MKVFIEREGKEKTLKFQGKVIELLRKLKINSETVLVTRDSELLTDDEKITNSDDIKIISVISGG